MFCLKNHFHALLTFKNGTTTTKSSSQTRGVDVAVKRDVLMLAQKVEKIFVLLFFAGVVQAQPQKGSLCARSEDKTKTEEA